MNHLSTSEESFTKFVSSDPDSCPHEPGRSLRRPGAKEPGEVSGMVRAAVFDAYGTLFDIHSLTAACEAAFPGRSEAINRLWRQKQLEYSMPWVNRGGAPPDALDLTPDHTVPDLTGLAFL